MSLRSISILVILNVTLSLYAIIPFPVKIWSDSIPGTNGITEKEELRADGMIIVANVTTPEIYLYLPPKSDTPVPVVLICPGGSYAVEAIDHEGHQFARWLASNGIAGAVLKYRLPNGHHNIPLMDAKQGIRFLRSNSEKWNLDTKKTGVAGFSAGGHLAATLGTHYDQDCRPDFMVLFYPVISMNTALTHMGSRHNLLGYERDNQSWIDYYSNELHVTKDTPRTILFLNDDDDVVSPVNGLKFYESLHAHQVEASVYLFPKGGHGWGASTEFPFYSQWTTLLRQWFNL